MQLFQKPDKTEILNLHVQALHSHKPVRKLYFITSQIRAIPPQLDTGSPGMKSAPSGQPQLLVVLPSRLFLQ